MSPIHLPVSPLGTFLPWSYTSHFISFRCAIHQYVNASGTSICFSDHSLEPAHISLDCVIRMLADVVTGRSRACCKPIPLTGDNKKRNFMDHVLKHVSLTILPAIEGVVDFATRSIKWFHVIPHFLCLCVYVSMVWGSATDCIAVVIMFEFWCFHSVKEGGIKVQANGW